MNDQEKEIEIIRGQGTAKPDTAPEILRKLLGDGELKPTAFLKDPGSVIEAHFHTEDLSAYVLKGKIRIQTGEDLSNVVEFVPGDAFKMKKGTIHREEVIGDVPCEMTGGYINDYKTVQVEIK